MSAVLNPLAIFFELKQLEHAEEQSRLARERNEMAREDQAINLEQLKLAYRRDERDEEQLRLSRRAELRDEEKLKLYNLKTMMDFERYQREIRENCYKLFTSKDIDNTEFMLRTDKVENSFGNIILWYKGKQCQGLSITESQLYVVADNATMGQMQDVIEAFITCVLKQQEDISRLDNMLQHMALLPVKPGFEKLGSNRLWRKFLDAKDDTYQMAQQVWNYIDTKSKTDAEMAVQAANYEAVLYIAIRNQM